MRREERNRGRGIGSIAERRSYRLSRTLTMEDKGRVAHHCYCQQPREPPRLFRVRQ
jgi:hypothetical protein